MFVKGDLYVHFTVEFPKDSELPDETVELLRKSLPSPSMQVDYDEQIAEVAHLDHADISNFGSGGATATSSAGGADRSGPQPVQCQQS
jgi:hypothetical protein